MQHIEMHEVESSNIAAVGYDSETETLQIRFHSGKTYQFYGVPDNLFEGLLTAESVGKYFAANVRGQYEYKKLDDESE